MNNSAAPSRPSVLAREYLREDFAYFIATAKILNKSHRDLSSELGYSQSAWNGWASSGQMPATAAKLCRAMQAAAEQAAAAPETKGWKVVLIKVNKQSQQDALLALAKGLGCEAAVL
jgi:hypothetical protein